MAERITEAMASKWLGELLAIIHRDGGHYQAQHGTEKAVEDAHAILAAALSAEPGAEGMVLVPRVPTPEMLGAWYRYKNGHHWPDEPPPRDTSDVGAYAAMLAAATQGGR